MSYQLDSSTITSSALTVTNCSGYRVNGRITYDSDTLYFMPSERLSSFCTHKVTVDSSIKGLKGETQTSTHSWQFETDGLKVNAVYVTYAYSDYVDVYAPIQVKFNYPVGYVYSGDIYLQDSSYNRVSGSLYRSGNTVEFLPSSRLSYGKEYKLVVTTSVKGSNGEKLKSEDVTYFNTENMPLDILDYGPTGTVYTDDIFWVDMSETSSTQGFPRYSGSMSPYVSTSLSTDAYYIVMTPYSSLSYNTNYNVKFSFDFDGGSTDDFTFDWNVLTENYAANKTSVGVLSASNKAERLTAAGKKKSGCRNNVDCFGRLKPKTKAEFKKTLAVKKKVNVRPKEVQERIKTLNSLKRIQ